MVNKKKLWVVGGGFICSEMDPKSPQFIIIRLTRKYMDRFPTTGGKGRPRLRCWRPTENTWQQFLCMRCPDTLPVLYPPKLHPFRELGNHRGRPGVQGRTVSRTGSLLGLRRRKRRRVAHNSYVIRGHFHLESQPLADGLYKLGLLTGKGGANV